MLVVVDRPDGEVGDRGLVARLDWLRAEGVPTALLVWDASDLGPRLGRRRAVFEVEAINRWRLPQWFERRGARRAMRALRHLRMRWWWARLARCRVAYLCGPLRAEMRHYLPPRCAVVADLADGDAERADGEGPAAAVTRSFGGPVVVADGAAHDRNDLVVAARVAPAALGGAVALRRRWRVPPAPPGALVVGSWGPSDRAPLLGASGFLRLVWLLRRRHPGLPLQGLWAGGDEHPGLPVVAGERRRLGLDEHVHLLPEQALQPAMADLLHVAALVHPGGVRRWHADAMVAAGVPLVGFEQTELTSPGCAAPWPDLDALADLVVARFHAAEAGAADLATVLTLLERS